MVRQLLNKEQYFGPALETLALNILSSTIAFSKGDEVLVQTDVGRIEYKVVALEVYDVSVESTITVVLKRVKVL